MAENYAIELKKLELGLNLHEHQILGVKHILQWYNEGHGGIIADEMGLGKTCQAVSAIVCLLNDNRTGRHMVICPLSVLQHWQNELFRFGLGKLRILTYIGNSDARRVVRKKLQNSKDWNVLITTYEMVINDEQYFHWSWSSLFIDEAHRLKSSKSILHQIVRKMSVEFMVLMTGTPVQNNINELYSLLSLIDTNRFPLLDEQQFVAKYRNTYDTVAELQHMLSKYLIRRTKQMLRIKIPDSSEVLLYHGITEMQKNIYRAILRKNYQYFKNVDDKKIEYAGSKLSLLNVLTQLRKCVAHPYLFDGVEPEPFKEGDHLFEVSGKFLLLDRLLTFLFAKGHRVLIFSQMTRVLDITQDYLVYKGYNYQRLDGSVRAEERFAAVNHFQTNSDIFCFLLSTRAGGLGLNLTGGDTVIFLDSDFNPQNDIQAAARCHRIGQTKPVKIIRLVARYTVEDMIQCRAARKLKMTQEILEKNNDDRKELTFAEISDLIIKGLNRLSNEKIDSEELNMEAIEKLIGKTDENGHWIYDGEEQNSKKRESVKKESDIPENIYIFEGHDYKQDVAVLQDILSESKTMELVRNTSVKESLPIERRTRKLISKEENEKRVKKRRETLEQKKRLREEEIERKRKEQEARKAMKWLKNNYKSSSLPLQEMHDIQHGDSSTDFGPHFVYGSVTDTLIAPNDNSNHALIVHVVDDSGLFGHGGVFDVLRRKSQKIVDRYELAGKMDDLHVGDAHLVEDIADDLPVTLLKHEYDRSRNNIDIDEAEQSTSKTFPPRRKLSVVLLVAQDHRRRDIIDQDILTKCLKKLAFYAVNSNILSVHMPRIGYDKQNISWYAVERLINRILVSKGIHTYIYYFNRRVNNATGKNINKAPKKKQKFLPLKKGRMNDKAGSDFEEMKGEDMEQAEKYEDKESSA
ncbi:Helicase conserved C-terminal domain containing protein [Brugia malayi]|uniref:Bm9441 n=2 Tax=Brugia TaxID=6278 RepID=A0A0K0JZB5_BRUMA|nr:Helicase conserved C-terminal domain containing protein [Brugia malayi]CRZ23736.1 Bm9441 [Brugia malayi]VIO95901.1 Helicase conserved C-terminal domain containing protein [Brugia malayi]